MDEQITIIDGPTPVFEHVDDAWAMGLNESPHVLVPAITKLRATNGIALVERCHRAWRHQRPIQLEYRSIDGLENQAPILAARTMEIDDGQVLLLWVRLEIDEETLKSELGDGFDDDDADDFSDDPGFPDR